MICSRFIPSAGWESHRGKDDVCLPIVAALEPGTVPGPWWAPGKCLLNKWSVQIFLSHRSLHLCTPVWLQCCVILTLQNSLVFCCIVILDASHLCGNMDRWSSQLGSEFFEDWARVSDHHPLIAVIIPKTMIQLLLIILIRSTYHLPGTALRALHVLP